MERDQDGRLFHQHSPNFNSHAHVERDTIERELKKHGIDFNSHAHVERDFKPMRDTLPYIIISTHTLTWSVTVGYLISKYCLKDFNSHAHVERDYGFGSLTLDLHISTHTLTWSVTVEKQFADFDLEISTHTLTWSVTLCRRSSIVSLQFQLTRSRGA